MIGYWKITRKLRGSISEWNVCSNLVFVINDWEKAIKKWINVTCHAVYEYFRSLELLPLGNGLQYFHTTCQESSLHILFPFQVDTCHLISSEFLISKFRRVLNVVRFHLGNSPASEMYMPTFRNTLFNIHRQVNMKNDWGFRMLGYL